MSTFQTYFVDVLKNKYAQFEGRARRAEFWYFVLYNGLIYMAFSIIDNLVFGGSFPILGTIYSLAVLVPGLAIAVRRLHDTNRSGWFLLIALIPLIGAIWLIVLYTTPGTIGENQYGPDPKAGEAAV